MASVNERSLALSPAPMERGIDHRRHCLHVRQTFTAEEFHQLRYSRRRIAYQGWIVDFQPFDVWRVPTPPAHLFAVSTQPALQLVEIETGTLGPKARRHRLLGRNHFCNRSHHKYNL